MATEQGNAPAPNRPGYDPALEKPEWAMGRRERENARRRRAGQKPLPPRWPWILLVLVVLGAGGYWYYQTQIVPTLPLPEVVSTAPVDDTPPVMQINSFEYDVVAPQTLRQVIRVTGTLQPSQQTQIASLSSGRVEEVTVRPGDQVEAGDLLVQVDVEELRLQLDSQRANAAATQSQLTLAEAQYERSQALVERGVATTSDLDSARTSVEGLVAQVSALNDQVASAELRLAQATVTSPFSGIVSERSVEPGQFVSVGAPLISLVDLSTVELVAQAPVSTGALISAGQIVTIEVDGLSGRRFEGEVVRINPIATAGARTIPVYVLIDNADHGLLGGMFAIGEVVVREAVDAIGLPEEAIREDREGYHVLVISGGAVERRAVEIGESWRGDIVEVIAGLNEGDTVVTAALPELDPGDLVELVE